MPSRGGDAIASDVEIAGRQKVRVKSRTFGVVGGFAKRSSEEEDDDVCFRNSPQPTRLLFRHLSPSAVTEEAEYPVSSIHYPLSSAGVECLVASV